MFFALKGENFNGNKFAKSAINNGAICAVIDEKEYDSQQNTIVVANVLQTLQALANHHRKYLNIPIIGLTGSNGKTTTKELINAVLARRYKTSATIGNLNNHIGVPLTLLTMNASTEIGIVEMGANHQKEIEQLCTISEPDFGYITNFGKAHLEGFGGIEGVIKGKSELYGYLRKNSKIAFVNANDPLQIENSKDIDTINLSSDIKLTSASPFVTFDYLGSTVKSNLIGAYNYVNIQAAISIGTYFKVAKKDIISAIETYTPNNNRSQIIQKGDNKIILDAYNANPSSMTAALTNFSNLNEKHKTVILGDMFELGTTSLIEHQNIVALAASLNFEQIIIVGENFSKTKSSKTVKFTTFEDFEKYFEPKPEVTYLIKGSRGMALERIIGLFD